jgi:SanA protein
MKKQKKKAKGFKFKRLLKIAVILAILGFLSTWSINKYVKNYSSDYIVDNLQEIPNAYTAIVLGSQVFNDGSLSTYMKDRADKTIELYKAGKVKRILVSGDHGTKEYDEVNTIKRYLNAAGIPDKDIFLDHAGFNTYNSMVRAKKIFKVKDAIIVTQKFHLPRSIFIAKKTGINAVGYVADNRNYYSGRRNSIRENLARVKSYFEVMFNISPEYLGDEIPITGDSFLTYD